MKNNKTQGILTAWLTERLDSNGRNFFDEARVEIAAGACDNRFCQIIALASRHARRKPLAPTDVERGVAAEVLPGWDPVDWSLLETLRVALVLARQDLHETSFAQTFEHFFRYADEGESSAFYRAIAFLPHGERYVWRAGEGCRTNMTSVFRAVACDNPFPVNHFNDIAWQQLLMKALFIGVPLWRIHGLDTRLSETVATMFLDYVDERTSAGRSVPADGWLLLGKHWSDRAAQAVETALAGDQASRRAAAVALARAGQKNQLSQWLTAETLDAERSRIRHMLSNIPVSTDLPYFLAESNDYAVL